MRPCPDCGKVFGHSDLDPGDPDHGHDGGESEADDDQATAEVGGPDPSGPGWEADQRREVC